MRERVWCEHLTWEQGTLKDDPRCGVWYFQRKSSTSFQCIVHNDEWVQCPICLTPRPEPRRGLAEKLENTFKNNYGYCSSTKPKPVWDAVSLCALEHFVALVDKHSYPQPTNEPILFSNELKRAMEASLNG